MDLRNAGNTAFSGGGGGRAEAERFLGIAEKLLMARDLVGSKTFAERSIEADPMMDGPDHLLAVADALLSAQDRVNNHVNWYSVLQVHPSDGPDSIRRQYRRLALLLHPDRNRFSGSDQAFKLVSDAFAVLSDTSKRSLFDKELQISSRRIGQSQPSDPSSFWTACPYCCNLYEYERAYHNRRLRCRNCRRGFHATEVPQLPPTVPGTDSYYCSWGFFPLGFPGANLGPAGPGIEGWKPFVPMFPWWSPTTGFSDKSGKDGGAAPPAVESSPNKRAAGAVKRPVGRPATRRTKMMAARRSRRQSVAPAGGSEERSGRQGSGGEKLFIDLEVPGDMMMGEDMVDMDGFVEASSGGGIHTGDGPVANSGQANGSGGGSGVNLGLDSIDVLDSLPKIPFLNTEEFDILIK
ncbi:hypothetical protein QJS04_geneDACA024819 [Acorus gramineus]|uniref:J domain-containing protein n=1 Tax=Acorus gramineus TaxID=55184 RepID=A0AAV9BQ05_ACOGR|nr:hypothetical protein QJS04_geneDACA024819 [Acorus gramineus]